MSWVFNIILFFASASDCSTFSTAKTSQAKFTYWGFHVYDITYTAKEAFPKAPFALELIYRRSFAGKDIVASSQEEMLRLGADQQDVKRWVEALKKIIPDVSPGDKLKGYVDDEKRSVFCRENKVLGAVDDPRFADYFFGIWLGDKSRRADIRDKLLRPIKNGEG